MEKKLEWYALNYDFNKKKLYNLNIFNNIRFSESVKRDIYEYQMNNFTYDEFKESIRIGLMSAFWSKREYELFIGDAFDTNIDNYEKIDVYSQVLPNLDILVDYILSNIEEN